MPIEIEENALDVAESAKKLDDARVKFKNKLCRIVISRFGADPLNFAAHLSVPRGECFLVNEETIIFSLCRDQAIAFPEVLHGAKNISKNNVVLATKKLLIVNPVADKKEFCLRAYLVLNRVDISAGLRAGDPNHARFNQLKTSRMTIL